jgi:hypothetical protein
VKRSARADWADAERGAARHAGQSGDDQDLSNIASSTSESVEELADTDQNLEASRVEGIEDAADHPERPVHTHDEYHRADEFPRRRGSR